MKKIITILVCVLVFSAMISGVFADTPASMSITASGDSIAPGEKVTFTVSVSKLESCTSAGIILGFDSNVYELDSWECLVDSAMMPSYDATTKLLSFANQGKALEGDIFRFVLKVKDSAKAGSSNVSGTPYLRKESATVDHRTCIFRWEDGFCISVDLHSRRLTLNFSKQALFCCQSISL